VQDGPSRVTFEIGRHMEKHDDGKEIESLFPPLQRVPVGSGHVEIRRLKLKDISRLAVPMANIIMAFEKLQNGVDDVTSAITEVSLTCQSEMCEVIAVATGRTREWAEELPLAAGFDLVKAIHDSNADFFEDRLRRLGRMIHSMKDGPGDGQTQSLPFTATGSSTLVN